MPVRGPITKLVASSCIARLLVLAAEDAQQPILAYIDSPGGLASEALRILSSLNGVDCPVATFCRGKQGGGATAIAAHGRSGFRACSPNARFSFKLDLETSRHKPAESYLKALAETLAQDSRQPLDRVLQWFASGTEFTAPEALKYGLIDAIALKPLLPDGQPAK